MSAEAAPARTPRVPRPGTVAIVGPDGAGKSTVITHLMGASPKLRYLYGGAAIEQANFALPTSRWLMRRWRKQLGPLLPEGAHMPPRAVMAEPLKQRLKRGPVLKVLGIANRVAEEWFRWAVAVTFRLRGFQVLWDRHFLFDYCPDSPAVRPDQVTERVHHWLLSRLYPRPDLVILLDAPPEVLYARKGEWDLDHLRRQRENMLAQGARTRAFAVVDATRPLDQVLSEVTAFVEGRRSVRRAQASVSGLRLPPGPDGDRTPT